MAWSSSRADWMWKSALQLFQQSMALQDLTPHTRIDIVPSMTYGNTGDDACQLQK